MKVEFVAIGERIRKRATTRMTRTVAIMSLLAVSQGVPAEVIERQIAAEADGEVAIINVSGRVDVKGWDRAEVQVRADLRTDRLEFRSEGHRTVVKVVRPERRGQAESVDLIVRVPRGSTVSVNTVSADQRIEDVRGMQRLQAVSGGIETSTWSEEFQIKTISGDIRVQGHDTAGLARLNSVSGDITLKDIAGELEIETVTGDMQVRMGELTRGRVQTTNGSVNLRAQLAKDARLDAEAINGDVSFLFNGRINGEFDIETFNGEIDNCFGPEAARTRDFGPGRSLRFKEGSGAARVRIKTLNGGIELCRD